MARSSRVSDARVQSQSAESPPNAPPTEAFARHAVAPTAGQDGPLCVCAQIRVAAVSLSAYPLLRARVTLASDE